MARKPPPPAAVPPPSVPPSAQVGETPRGLRALLREIGIVTAGVVIAIGLGQIVDQIHWAGELRGARISLSHEMSRANRSFAFRVAARACVARRIDALEAIAERAARGEPVPRLGAVIPDIGNGLNSNIWEAQRASQTLTHFGDGELSQFSAYYMSLANARQIISQETDALGVLRILQGDPARLGPADFSAIRIAIQQARFDNDLIADIDGAALDIARQLHQAIPAPDADRLKEVCAPLPLIH